MAHRIPDEIINKIVLMARPKPYFYIRHLTNIGEIVAYKTAKGNGNCRVIDYMATVANYKRLDKLRTTKHYLLLNQLEHLIMVFNDFKERTEDYHLCLGDWYKWWIYDHTFYTSGDDNYPSDSEYSSDDNYDY